MKYLSSITYFTSKISWKDHNSIKPNHRFHWKQVAVGFKEKYIVNYMSYHFYPDIEKKVQEILRLCSEINSILNKNSTKGQALANPEGINTNSSKE
jgi:hypothetical protein